MFAHNDIHKINNKFAHNDIHKINNKFAHNDIHKISNKMKFPYHKNDSLKMIF